MQSRDIQAEIHVIQTHLQAIKSDPAEAHLQADSFEQELEAIRARCESIRGHVAMPTDAAEPTPIGAAPEPVDAPLPAV